ncbi:MAG: TetR family transcriptional regulator C-terminal domain-containing protein [Candidatus Dormibacteraeota bacterium]|nr:TetR family transcriptional regulator C-terminal domain-containing protein [Candidatus Dormibacteraeota bacterium]
MPGFSGRLPGSRRRQRPSQDRRQLVEFLAGQIQPAGRGSRALPSNEAAHEAESLIALVDGLAAHTLAGFHTPDAAQALLERRLEQIFHEAGGSGGGAG